MSLSSPAPLITSLALHLTSSFSGLVFSGFVALHLRDYVYTSRKNIKNEKRVGMTLAEKVMKQEYRKCDMMFSQLHAQSRGVWPH